jgi:hypothetical protein
MTRYAKTVVAVIGAISVWGVTACAADGVSMAEWFGLLGAVATSLGVYLLPNTPPTGQPSNPNISEQDPQLA